MTSKTQPVIFLDFDGVIRNQGWVRASIQNLNDLVVRTDSRVVVSSDWRHSHTREDLKAALLEVGVLRGICMQLELTPVFPEDLDSLDGCQPRLDEINTYITLNNVVDFVVLDDMAPLAETELAPRLVLCEYEEGFTEEKLNEALKILTR